MGTKEQRESLLRQFARDVERNAINGALLSEPVPIRRLTPICGPRAGAIEFTAGSHTGPLLAKLSKHSDALLRQLIPWPFVGAPIAFMRGRYLRLEAGWPSALADTQIRLDEIGRCPGDKLNRWTVGVNERGVRVTTSFKTLTPHWLISGQTQSGKSTAGRSLCLQLAKGSNQLVLCDGKRGESLHVAAHWHGVVGPVAKDVEDVRNALGWAHDQMIRRYDIIERGGDPAQFRLIIVVFDEFQELTTDPIVSTLMRKLAAQGAAGRVHCVSLTQHPVIAAFGDQRKTGTITRRQFPGLLSFRVADAEASRVSVGGETPRADHLLGMGDAYLVAPGAVHRIQGAYVDESDFARTPTGQWVFDTWPEFDPASIGKQARGGNSWGPEEAAIGILAAMEGKGRPLMLRLFEEYELPKPGATKGQRLLKWGRKVWKVLAEAPEMAERGVV